MTRRGLLPFDPERATFVPSLSPQALAQYNELYTVLLGSRMSHRKVDPSTKIPEPLAGELRKWRKTHKEAEK